MDFLNASLSHSTAAQTLNSKTQSSSNGSIELNNLAENNTAPAEQPATPSRSTTTIADTFVSGVSNYLDASEAIYSAVAPPIGPVSAAIKGAGLINGVLNSFINSPWSTNGNYLGGASDPSATKVLQGTAEDSTKFSATPATDGFTHYRDDTQTLTSTNKMCLPIMRPGWRHFSMPQYFSSWRQIGSGTIGTAAEGTVFTYDLNRDNIVNALVSTDTITITQGIFSVKTMISMLETIIHSRFALEVMIEAPTNIFNSLPLAMAFLPPNTATDQSTLERYLVPGVQAQMRETSRMSMQLPWYPVPEYVSFNEAFNLGTLVVFTPLTTDYRDSPIPYSLFFRFTDFQVTDFCIFNETQANTEPQPAHIDSTILAPGVPDKPLVVGKDAFCMTDMLSAAHRLFTAERPIEWNDIKYADRVFTTITTSGLTKDNINFLWPICPNALASRNNSGDNTAPLYVHPLWIIAQAYAYWQGGLEYNIQIVSTATSAGRILIAHWPINKSSSTVTPYEIKSMYNQVIDLNMGRSMRFTANQKGSWKIRRTARASSFEEAGLAITNPMSMTDGYGCSDSQTTHGWLVIMPLTNLSLNNVPTTGVLEYAISARACKDLAFRLCVGLPSTLQVTQGDPEPQQLAVMPNFDIPVDEDPFRTVLRLPIIFNALGTYDYRLADFPAWPLIKTAFHCRGPAEVTLELSGPAMMTGKLEILIHKNNQLPQSVIVSTTPSNATLNNVSNIRGRMIIDVSKQRSVTFVCPWDYFEPLLPVDENPYMARFTLALRNFSLPLASDGALRIKGFVRLGHEQNQFYMYNQRAVAIKHNATQRSLAPSIQETQGDPDPQQLCCLCERKCTNQLIPAVQNLPRGLAIGTMKRKIIPEPSRTNATRRPLIHGRVLLTGNLWEAYLKHHYANNEHHKENPNFSHRHDMHLCCHLDVFSSLTRVCPTVGAAYRRTIDILSTEAFSAAHCCTQRFIDLMHTHMQGPNGVRLYNIQAPIIHYNEWRSASWIQMCANREFGCTAQELVSYMLYHMTSEERDVFVQHFTPMRRCLMEINAHIDSMQALLTLASIEEPTHDADKLDFDMFIAYFLKWGMQMETIEDLKGSRPTVRSEDIIPFTKYQKMLMKEQETQGPPNAQDAQGSFMAKFKPAVFTNMEKAAESIDAAATSFKNNNETIAAFLESVKQFITKKCSKIGKLQDLSTEQCVQKIIELCCTGIVCWRASDNITRMASIVQFLTSLGITTSVATLVYSKLMQFLWPEKVSKAPTALKVTEDENFTTVNIQMHTDASILGDLLRTKTAKTELKPGDLIPLGVPFALFSIGWAFFRGSDASHKEYFGFIKTLGDLSRSFLSITAASVFTYEVITLLIDVLQRLYAYVIGDKFPELESLKNQEPAYNKLFAWLEKSSHFADKTPEEIIHDPTESIDLRAHYAQGEALEKELLQMNREHKIAPVVIGFLGRAMDPIRKLITMANSARAACVTRKTPYAIRLLGNPGVHKTSIIPALAIALSAKMGYKAESIQASCYSWGINDDFHQGYTGQYNVRIEEPDADKTSNSAQIEILRLISSDPYLVSKASLEEKNTWFTSPFIWLSSNTKDPQIAVRCPDAYFRRFRDVEVTHDTKRIYSKEETDQYLHLRFTVGNTRPGQTGNNPIANANIEQFINWLEGDARRHFASEDIASSYTESMYQKHVLSAQVTEASDPEEEFQDAEPEESDKYINMMTMCVTLMKKGCDYDNLYAALTNIVDAKGTPADFERADAAEDGLKAVYRLKTQVQAPIISHFNHDPFQQPTEPILVEPELEKTEVTFDNVVDEKITRAVNKHKRKPLCPDGFQPEDIVMAALICQADATTVENLVTAKMRRIELTIKGILGAHILPAGLYLIGNLVMRYGKKIFLKKMSRTEFKVLTGNANILAYHSFISDLALEDNPESQGVYSRYAAIADLELLAKAFANLERFPHFKKAVLNLAQTYYAEFALAIQMPAIHESQIALTQQELKKILNENVAKAWHDKMYHNISNWFWLQPTYVKVVGVLVAWGIIGTIIKGIFRLIGMFFGTAVPAAVNQVRRVFKKERVEIDGRSMEVLVETQTYDGTAHPAPAIQVRTQGNEFPMSDIYSSLISPSMGIFSVYFYGKNMEPMVFNIHVLSVGGQWMMTTEHNWDLLHRYEAQGYTLHNSQGEFRIYPKDLECHKLNDKVDVVLFRVLKSRIPNARALYKHFIRRDELARAAVIDIQLIAADPGVVYNARVEKRTPELTFHQDRARLSLVPVHASNSHVDKVYITTNSWAHNTPLPGSCGLPILSRETALPRVLGIHIAGSLVDANGSGAVVTHEDLKEFFAKHDELMVCAPAMRATQAAPDHRILPEGDYAVFCDPLPREMISHLPTKHHYEKMPTFEMFSKNDREPAPLSDYDHRNVYHESILKNCAAKYSQIGQPFPPEYLQAFREGMTQEIDQLPTPRVRLLTQSQAINGIKGTHVERMNMESSPGYPFLGWKEVQKVKGKKGLFEEHPIDGEPFFVPTERFQESIDSLLSSWMEGEREPTFYKDAQKVELLPLKKTRPYMYAVYADHDMDEVMPIYSGPRKIAERCPVVGDQIKPTRTFKCRLINTPPAHRTVLARMFNAGLNAHLMEFRHETGVLVGINPCSSEWGRLVTKLSSYAPTFNDTDFENFDGVHQRSVVDTIAGIYFDFLMLDPVFASSKDLQRAFWACWDEAVVRHVIVQNLGYIVGHGLASGHDCTVQINTLAQLFYFFVAWMEIMSVLRPELANFHSFRKYFWLLGYGDDGLWTAVLQLQDIFTAGEVARILKKYGITMTPANKGTVFEAPKPIEQVTFLSRSFTPHPTHKGVYYAMLKTESQEALLNWVYTKSRSLNVAVPDNIEQYMRHAFMRGREFYEKRVHELARVVPQHVAHLPTWRQLEDEFLAAWGFTIGTPKAVVPTSLCGGGEEDNEHCGIMNFFYASARVAVDDAV